MSKDKQLKDKKLAELKAKRHQIAEMGGKERVAAQINKGKLTARARINALLDKGTFHEMGMFVHSRNDSYENVPADAVVTGYGEIDGRRSMSMPRISPVWVAPWLRCNRRRFAI